MIMLLFFGCFTLRLLATSLAERAKIDAGARWGEHGHQHQERPRHLRAAQRALLGGLNRGRSGWQANAGSPARPGRAAGRRGCRQGVRRCARAKFLAEIFKKKFFSWHLLPSGFNPAGRCMVRTHAMPCMRMHAWMHMDRWRAPAAGAAACTGWSRGALGCLPGGRPSALVAP